MHLCHFRACSLHITKLIVMLAAVVREGTRRWDKAQQSPYFTVHNGTASHQVRIRNPCNTMLHTSVVANSFPQHSTLIGAIGHNRRADLAGLVSLM